MNQPSLDQPSHLLTLQQLLSELEALREHVIQRGNVRLEPFSEAFRDGVFTRSAVNLAHYLALRELDLRQLQIRLAQVGLSSLGRAESSVLSTLDAVIDILSRATGEDRELVADKDPSEFGFNRGHQLLDQHTTELFGPCYEKSGAHVMVTLGTEAAWDYSLICRLLKQGMTCARINCAHDDAILWHAMIRNVRRAEAETARPCRILMDLAGHKIRTGDMVLGPAVHHLKVRRDLYGKCLTPARLVLYRGSVSELPEELIRTQFCLEIEEPWFTLLDQGFSLQISDARGKHRTLQLEKAVSDNAWQFCSDEGIYLASESPVTLLNSHHEEVAEFTLSAFSGQPAKVVLGQGETFLLTTDEHAGRPALFDQEGKVIHPARIGCTLKEAIHKLKPGDPVWIDDGKLGAEVRAVDDKGAWLKVVCAREGGVTIRQDKGINFPETDLGLPSLSHKDRHDLDFACQHADMIGFSFVESLADMDCLIAELAKRGATDLPIIAKIETNRAVKNLPEIILGTIGRHCLGIMIARGDLAVELGSARLAEVQEEMLWVCEAAHVPVIWATQVLESIAKKGMRSRPEFTDAAMGVRAECVMLNKGPFVLEALSSLINVMVRMQGHQHKKFSRLRALHW